MTGAEKGRQQQQSVAHAKPLGAAMTQVVQPLLRQQCSTGFHLRALLLLAQGGGLIGQRL